MQKKQLSEYDFAGGEVLLVNKPRTWTSFDVVRKTRYLIKHALGKKVKVGHAGTLDPLANGLVMVCTGRKTKTIESIQALEKEYIANIRLGATTPSFDLETEIDAHYPTEHITTESIAKTLKSFVGEQLQTPPVFSAKKIDGKRAYESARQGKKITMKRAMITIYELELLESNMPDLKVRIVCSKGTYIRSLAHDIGKKLQSGAHLAGLQRTRIGHFTLAQALSPEDLDSLFGHSPKTNKTPSV